MRVNGQINKLRSSLDRRVHRGKQVGRKTQKLRKNNVHLAFQELTAIDRRLRCPCELTKDHIMSLAGRWAGRDLAGKTVIDYLIEIRRILQDGCKIPPDGIVPENSLVLKALRIKRRKRGTQNRSADHFCADVDGLLAQVFAAEPRVGLVLRLCYVFGLRLLEAMCFRPHEDWLGEGTPICLRHGCKNGRERVLDMIELGPAELDLLKCARDYCTDTPKGSLTPYSGNLRKDIQRFRSRIYRVCKRFGISHSGLGFSPHGFRYAACHRLYFDMTATLPPIAGGTGAATASLDREAREAVARFLGHNRIEISEAYLGVGAWSFHSDVAVCRPPHALRTPFLTRSNRRRDYRYQKRRRHVVRRAVPSSHDYARI